MVIFFKYIAILYLSFLDDTLFVPTEQRDIVREYIEELVASMIGGGSLDNVPIGQLYKDLECKFIDFFLMLLTSNIIGKDFPNLN